MRKRIAVGLFALTAGLILTLDAPSGAAENEKDAPKFQYGHDLLVRKGGVSAFDKNTPRVGLEVFKDDVTDTLIGVSDTGAIAVIKAAPVGTERICKWIAAHDLNTRKAGEAEFTTSTKKFGVELFLDQGAKHLLYACESGSIAFAPVPPGLVKDRGPDWHHGLEAKIRGTQQTSFDDAKKLGIEVFKDENTGTPGTLIYITEKGAIATAPAPATRPDKNKIEPPKTAYGLVLSVRGANEENFSDKTKKIEVEVFEDPNASGRLLYITDAGSIATAPNPGKFADAKGVNWKRAVALNARPGGDKSFDKAKKYGIEVFQDNRTGHLIFISDTGAIAVLPKQ